MAEQFWLSDAQWAVLEPLLPQSGGRPRFDGLACLQPLSSPASRSGLAACGTAATRFAASRTSWT